MIRTLLLAFICLAALEAGDAATPTGAAASRMLKEIARLKPDSTEVQRINALSDVHREVRSTIAAQLNDTAPYVDAGIAASGPKAQPPVRSFWAPLVDACTIDRPKEGRPLLNTILANPKLPIKARGWIISHVMLNAGAGQAIAWLSPEMMLQSAKDLSQAPDTFLTVTTIAISTTGDGNPVNTAFTGPMLAASILQGYFSIPLPPRWDDTLTNAPEVLASRAAMLAQLPIALEDAAQRCAIAVSAHHVLGNWPRFSYGPHQRSWLAHLMIGSRRADLALLQEVIQLARSEIRRQPNADQALAADYLEGIRRMWEDGALPRNAAGSNRSHIGTIPPLPPIPDSLSPDAVDAWIKGSLAIIKPALLERATGGLVSADLDALNIALGMAP